MKRNAMLMLVDLSAESFRRRPVHISGECILVEPGTRKYHNITDSVSISFLLWCINFNASHQSVEK